MKALISYNEEDDIVENIDVQISERDCWSLDITLAHIIHPALIKLREMKHGSPITDDEDVPEHLKSISAPPVGENWTDDNFHERWEWILDEMIWAFHQLTFAFEDQFYLDKVVWKFSESGTINYDSEHPKVFDKEGYFAHMERMNNGFRLFGKYYSSLWD